MTAMRKISKHLAMVLFAMLLGITAVMAQKRTVTGEVTDNAGKPVPSATVTVKGTTISTISDDNGRYSITFDKAGAVLLITSVGFAPKELTVGNNTTFVTSLELAAGQTEVIVTALGIKKEAKSLGYSAQKVGGVDITKASAPDLATGLMGKSAGLNISMSNGIQGNSQRIVIRGNNSILGRNQPLIVVDGIQVENNPVGGSQTAAGGTDLAAGKDWGSFMNFLNGDDVQDVTVLKGATAAALYGARGGNGVILVTTKKGMKRSGFGLDYNVSSLFSNAYRFQDVQNEYGHGGTNSMWSAAPAFPTDASGNLRFPGRYSWDGTPVDPKYSSANLIPGGYNSWDVFSWFGPSSSWGHKLDGTEIIWWDGVKRKWDPQPDNRKAYFRTGNTTIHNLAFNKAGDFGSVRFGYTRQDNNAIIQNSDYSMNNFNLGSSLNISKMLKAEITATYNNYNRLNVPDIGGDNGWSKFMIYSMSREYQPIEFDTYKNADGSRRDFSSRPNAAYGFYPYQNNNNHKLFWQFFEQNQRLNRNQLLGSVKLSADFTPWLNITGRASLNNTNASIESKYSPVDVGGVQGQYGVEATKNQETNFEVFTTLHKEDIFNSKFNTSLMVGNSALRSRYYGSSAWNSGERDAVNGAGSNYPWAVPFKYYLRNTTYAGSYIQGPTETWNNYNINSIFGVFDISYDNYLFLQVTGRNDWTSTLPANNNSYFYPSANLSFVFTDAIKSLQKSDLLSYGKLKVSAAKSASGADAYLAQYNYRTDVSSNYINGTAPITFGGLPVTGYPLAIPPFNLLPQTNTSYEAGVELGFLKNRLNVQLTAYKTKAYNQILTGGLNSSSGATGVTFNTGELSNKGFEFIVSATPVLTRNFKWDVSVNGAHNSNKVVSLGKGVEKYYLQDLFGTSGVQMYVRPGENYGTIYGKDYLRNANGEKIVQRVYDKNDPTKVVGTQYMVTADPIAIGNATPKLTGGISNSVRYKNFSLYLLVDFKIGGEIYSTDYAIAMENGLSPETLKERNGGGLPFTYPDGTTANHGVVLDGVFADGKANTDVVHYMWKYPGQYAGWTNVDHMPRSTGIFTNSWGKLREFNLSYSVPTQAIQKLKFIQGLDISLIGRNLFYIFTTLPDNLNPEAINGIGNGQGIQYAQYPGTREYGFAVKVKF